MLLKTFWFSAVATVVVLAAVAFGLGPAGLLIVVVLSLLEITLSFDNAVVNAKLLGFMSPWWQRFFMTFGIFVAVFVVRFAFPVLIVAVTSGLGMGEVLNLAWNEPERYSQELQKSAHAIDAFGGMFLLMIAAGFFLDASKKVHWLRPLERRLTALGRHDNVAILALSLGAVVVASTMHGTAEERLVVLIAAVCGIAANMTLGIFGAATEGDGDDDKAAMRQLVGIAAFVMFLRLEVLDASFSLDGVIGAFAISTNVVIIMAGLGIGALWVRSMTVYLTRAGTLAKYRFLEHGAHWAIGVLGAVMIVKLYGAHLPEWLVGSIGLVFIAFAVASSVRHRRRDNAAVT